MKKQFATIAFAACLLWAPILAAQPAAQPGVTYGQSSGGGGGSGTVTSVSVASANGLGGTVANATTTPQITLNVSVTGLLKGNGTTISAATAGTDYLAPTGSGAALTGITSGQISGLAASATTDTTNASNISSGTLAAVRLPAAASFTTSLGAGVTTITSANSSALAVGLNGATNPALSVDASTASSATGFNIKSAAAGNGVTVSAISSAANEALTIQSKGAGSIVLNTPTANNIQFEQVGVVKAYVNTNVFVVSEGLLIKRTAVADAAYSLSSADYMVAFTSLTATRQVTLTASVGFAASPQYYIIKDESGNAGSFPITFSATIDGATKTINTAYGVLRIYYNGTAWFSW